MKATRRACGCKLVSGAGLVYVLALGTLASGNEPARHILDTGSGQALTSVERRITDDLLDATVLRFRFAFGTDELPGAGEFKDSFTIGVSSTGENENLLYLTADIFGVHWLPANPGGIFMTDSSVIRVEAPAPVEMDGFGSVRSYRIQAELPPQFIGRAVDLRVDLFDNGNEVGSRGFIDEITVVPEPSVLALFALFLTSLMTARKIRK